MKDDYELYFNRDISRKCDSCGNSNHFITQCPLLTLQLEKEKVISFYKENSDFATRKKFNRGWKKNNPKQKFLKFQLVTKGFLNEKTELCFFIFNFHYKSNLLKLNIGSNYLERIGNNEEDLSSGIITSPNKNNKTPNFDKGQNQELEDPFEEPSLLSAPIDSVILPKFKKRKPSLCNSERMIKIEELSEKSSMEIEKKEEKMTPHLLKDFKKKHFLKINKIDIQENISPINSTLIHQNFNDLFELSLNFDIMKNYQFYFPYNNPELIIKKLDISRCSRSEIKRKRFHNKKKSGKS